MKRAKTQATTRRVSGRKTNSAPAVVNDYDTNADLDENDIFIAAISSSESNTNILSRTVPLHEEVTKYIRIMKPLAEDSRDAMQFWSTHHSSLPILFSIIKRILPARPCSTDVERLFSLTGHICSPLRARLSPEMVNKQACLNMWLRDHYGIFNSTRVKARNLAFVKFVTINVNLSIKRPEVPDDKEDDCSDSDSEVEEV